MRFPDAEARLVSFRGDRKDDANALRVAYLTNQLPFPPHSGGQLREAETLRRLSSRVAIDFFAVTGAFERDVVAVKTEALRFCRTITLARATAPPASVRHQVPERVTEHASSEMTIALERFLTVEQVDLVHVEGYFMMQHVPVNLSTPVLLVEENIEYDLERMWEHNDSKTRVPWLISRDLERAAWRRATRCAAVTERDAEQIRQFLGADVACLFPGCDHLASELAELPDERCDSRPVALFIGNLSWGPSRDAAIYLLTEIWPRVRARVPEARLVIAGAGEEHAPELAETASDVTVTGRVTSMAPYLAGAHVVLCPIRVGGGVKAKLLESIHAGRAVVSTSVGIQGVPPSVGRAVSIADDTDDFALRTSELLASPQRRRSSEARALDVRCFLPRWEDFAAEVFSAWQWTARSDGDSGIGQSCAGANS